MENPTSKAYQSFKEVLKCKCFVISSSQQAEVTVVDSLLVETLLMFVSSSVWGWGGGKYGIGWWAWVL